MADSQSRVSEVQAHHVDSKLLTTSDEMHLIPTDPLLPAGQPQNLNLSWTLTSLPAEIHERILSFLDTASLISIATTARCFATLAQINLVHSIHIQNSKSTWVHNSKFHLKLLETVSQKPLLCRYINTLHINIWESPLAPALCPLLEFILFRSSRLANCQIYVLEGTTFHKSLYSLLSNPNALQLQSLRTLIVMIGAPSMLNLWKYIYNAAMQLESLHIVCTNDGQMEDPKLQFHTRLQKVDIEGCSSSVIQAVIQSCSKSLRILRLGSCSDDLLISLPSLPNLRNVTFGDFLNLHYISTIIQSSVAISALFFIGDTEIINVVDRYIKKLRELQSLTIEDSMWMPSAQAIFTNWFSQRAFPKLEVLKFYNYDTFTGIAPFLPSSCRKIVFMEDKQADAIYEWLQNNKTGDTGHLDIVLTEADANDAEGQRRMIERQCLEKYSDLPGITFRVCKWSHYSPFVDPEAQNY